MKKVYHEMVYDNYYQNFKEAEQALNDTITSIHTCFKKILDDNEFTNEQEARWNGMLNTIAEHAATLITKIDAKYGEMEAKANYFDDLLTKVDQNAAAALSEKDGHTTYECKCSQVGFDSKGYPAVAYNISKTVETEKEIDGEMKWVAGSPNTGQMSFSIRNDADYESYVTNRMTQTKTRF